MLFYIDKNLLIIVILFVYWFLLFFLYSIIYSFISLNYFFIYIKGCSRYIYFSFSIIKIYSKLSIWYNKAVDFWPKDIANFLSIFKRLSYNSSGNLAINIISYSNKKLTSIVSIYLWINIRLYLIEIVGQH